MSNKIKKVCALHDLSSFGRCALTVIIPTMSRLGIQVVPIPTAILSTHTGGFDNIFFKDMTSQMINIAEHLNSLGINFDALYTGFLGSEYQIEAVEKIIDMFVKKETLFLLDPVMGDDGALYSTYNQKMVEGMKHLCSRAHIITPNLTEACLLSDEEYPDFSLLSVKETEALSGELIKKLSAKYPNADIVITGVICKERMITLCKEKGKQTEYTSTALLPISFPGTGDLFASLFLSEKMLGKTIFECTEYASEMTSLAVKMSQETDEEIRNGVLLEKFIYEAKF